MKKRILSMLMVMIMMVSVLPVSVFATDGDSDHEHIWSATEYGKNDTHHWNICKGSGTCDVTAAESMYGYTEHTLVVDTTNTDASKVVKKCVCGYSTEEHAHVWATALSYDDTNHWYECTADGCTSPVATKDVAAHVWTEDAANTTATNKAYKCECGAPKAEHVHVWATTVSWDENHHWYACTDSSCGAINGENIHWDYNGNDVCDFTGCGATVTGKTFTSLTITGLTEPTDGATADFTIDIAEVGYDIPLVKVTWNRVTDISKGTSEAIGATSTYSAGYAYSVGIVVPVTWNDTIDDNIQITLNGKKIPYYSAAAFEAAQKTFEGKETVYMAKVANVNGKQAIVIGVMYPKLAGTHVCSFGTDWVETPAKHYHLCSGCGETKDTEYHYDNNKSGLCDVCGFDMKYYNKNATATSGTGTASGHTHTYSTDWVEDISNHWKQCTGCGAVTQKAAHADLNDTGKCDVCGFVMKAEAGHTHTFASDWTETFAQHYKVCSCGAKNEIAAHVDLNNTGKCDTCGYAMTTLSNNGIVADTGDDNATFLWLAAFAVSVLGAAATVLFARKKREE